MADAGEDFPTRSFSRQRPERTGPFVRIPNPEQQLEIEGYLVGHVLMEPADAQEAVHELTAAELTILELEMRSKREDLHLWDYDPFGRGRS